MRVLVVSDSERVRGLFERLELSGEVELRVVADLAHSDAEIAGFRPCYVFVHSRVAGLCVDIVLRHLKKLLPRDATVVVLAIDADDAALAKKQGLASLDLAEADDALTGGIARVLRDVPAVKKKGAKGKPVAPTKPRAARPVIAAATVPSCAADGAATGVEQVAKGNMVQRHQAPAEQPPPMREASQVAVDAASPIVQASFEEIMRRAALKEPPTAPPVHECSGEGNSAASPPAGGGPATPPSSLTVTGPGPDDSPASPPVTGGSSGDSPASPPDPIPEPRLCSRRRLVPLVLGLILAPLLYLLLNKPVGQKVGPGGMPPGGNETRISPPAPTTAPATSQGATPQGTPAKPASGGTAPPAQQRTGKAAPNPAALPPLPAAKPGPAAHEAGGAVATGMRDLPPFLAGVTKDPLYSKAHPGWQRYPGARAEYRLFREGGLYKAIQVIALTGQTVPDEIFRKVLSEFGATESYQVQSTELKERYLIEHCTGAGKVSISIYRRANDRRIKGLVVYYR